MKLLRIEVEHFGCIRRATVDLGPGLNVLFGPNDLGKSTLARAARAALLLPHTSSAANEFIEWDSDEAPFVKLTLELPTGHTWRVEKRFASPGGSSILRESTDGKTFSPHKKAREVDDELRTALGWGIASPATKGAPRGLPSSFLSRVLLGEQTDVVGVLRQTLEADSDESGRQRLTKALAAFAQDPLFKAILEEAQGQVDLAFTAKGNKRRGKTSPFRQVDDEVRRVKEELALITRQVEQSETAREELQAANDELQRTQETLQDAIETRDRLQEALKKAAERRATEKELEEAQAALDEQKAAVAALEEKQTVLATTHEQVREAKERHTSLASEVESLGEREKARAEALREARSDEAEREREIRRGKLEKMLLELDAEVKSVETEREAVAKARRLSRERAEHEAEKESKGATREAATRRANASAVAKATTEKELALIEVADRLRERRRITKSIEQLREVRSEVGADRAKAKEHRDEATELLARVPSGLPKGDALAQLLKLAQDLENAEARLGGGLAVVVKRLKSVAIDAKSDGVPVEAPGEGQVTFEATRGFELTIGDSVTVSVTAGEKDAREQAANLRAHWQEQGKPLLERLGLETLEEFRAQSVEAESLRKKARSAEEAVERLEERANDREAQLGRLAELESDRDALDRELEGEPKDAAAELLERLGERSPKEARGELEERLEEARSQLDAAQAEAREAESRIQVLEEKIAAANRGLAELQVEKPANGWDAHEDALEQRLDDLARKKEETRSELGTLAEQREAQVQDAEAALAETKEELAAAKARQTEAAEKLEELRGTASRLEGEIANREESVAKLDIEGAQARVKEIAARIEKLPEPAKDVTEEELAEARAAVEAEDAAHRRAHDAVRKAEGALQTVGGQVVLEQQQAVKEALAQAEQKERELELEFDSWKLLVEKLREAENTEGTHLGEALSQPVTERFGQLTANRYGKLDVAPNLDASGLEVAGVLRDIESFSAGTQEQLATLLRLTIAEQLETTLVLDDHLTQTDPARSAWFRDVLREHASKTQVIVVTCRPSDYLRPEDFPEEGEGAASRAGGLVRAIDLSRAIERSLANPAEGAA